MNTAPVVADVHVTPNLVFGAGALDQLGSRAREFGVRALLVTLRRGRLTQAGAPDHAEHILRSASVDVERYEVEPEPHDGIVESGAAHCRERNVQVVVGLGGGSALDAAKAIAFLSVASRPVTDYQTGQAEYDRPGLPVIAVPTTAGTGSEVSRVAVVLNRGLGIRKSLTHPYLTPRVALMDPSLTVSLPAPITAAVGLDALSHAAEAYVSLRANRFTDAVALHAVRLLGRSLPTAVEDGSDIEARGDALMGSCLAGIALNAGVGAAHILAQPISSVTALSHSQVISLLLPRVIETNLAHAEQRYGDLAAALWHARAAEGGHFAPTLLIEWIEKLREVVQLPNRFRDCGVTHEQLDEALVLALRWQGHITTNPRPVDEHVLRGILDAAY